MKRFFLMFLVLFLCIGCCACDKHTQPLEGSDGTDSFSDAEESGRPVVEEKYVALVDQLNNSIAVLDLNAADPTSDDAVIWEWTPTAELGFTKIKYVKNRLDEAKLRYSEAWGSYVVATCSSSGFLALVEYPSGRCLWNQEAPGYGPHSMEVLPDGNVAVACSGNGKSVNSVVRVYAARQGKESNVYAEVPLVSAHGVLWDPEYEVLWALGNAKIIALTVTGTLSSPQLTEVSNLSRPLPSNGGHDLSPVYGNPDRLWISSNKVWQFSKSEGKFYSDYEGASAISVGAVKSIGSFADGTVVQAIATNVYAAHDTDTLIVFGYTDTTVNAKFRRYSYRFPERAFYKARIFCADYQ